MEIEEILKNNKKRTMLLVAANSFIIAVLLFQTANNTGPLYEYIKPEVYHENYILESQYVGDITDNGKLYENVLIFEVTTMQNESETLYFANERIKRFDLQEGDKITVTWVKQKLDRPYINGVNKYVDVDLESGIDLGML